MSRIVKTTLSDMLIFRQYWTGRGRTLDKDMQGRLDRLQAEDDLERTRLAPKSMTPSIDT